MKEGFLLSYKGIFSTEVLKVWILVKIIHDFSITSLKKQLAQYQTHDQTTVFDDA